MIAATALRPCTAPWPAPRPVPTTQADLDDVEGLVRALLTEVELQAGGETQELQEKVDRLAME